MVASIQKADKFIGPALGLLALAVYLATLSAGAYPGAPATLAVQSMGLFPRLTPDYPLWNALAWLVGKCGIQALNTFSALCAGLGVALVYDVTRRAIISCFRNPEEVDFAANAARLAACGAALALAFCSPYWSIATRCHPAAFQICFLLFTVQCFFRFVATGSMRTAMLFSFLYGLGIVEYATFIAYLPLFGLGLIFLLWRRGLLSPGRAAKVLACLLAGLSLYVVAALAFYKSPGFEIRGYADFPQIVWFMWRDQYWALSRSLPQQGWLLILIVTVVPWVTALTMARQAMHGEQDKTFHFLHIVLTCLAVAVLLNAPIAPWPQFGFVRLLVMPYVLLAMTYGYLLAYWYVSSISWGRGERVDAGHRLLVYLGRGLAAVGLAFLLWLPFRNVKESSGRQAAVVNRFADALVGSLAGQRWLITNGVWDNHLLIAAHQQGLDLKTINIGESENKLYQNYIETLFDDAALRSRIHISLLTFVQEWFLTEPNIQSICAVQDRVDVWRNAGFEAIPAGLSFSGSRGLESLAVQDLISRNQALWDELQPYLEHHATHAGPLEDGIRNMLRHLALLANNLGFLLEDLNRPGDAFLAYSRAREIDPKNMSALLNQNAMINGGYVIDYADEIKQDLQTFLDDLKAQYRIGDVAAHYGLIRTPDAFVGLWQRATVPEVAAQDLRRAIKLSDAGKKTQLKEMLAEVYFLDAQDDETEMLYEELLVENPDSRRALIGMARLAMRRGQTDAARQYLEKAGGVGVPESLMSMEWASLDSVNGKLDRARERLEDLVARKPDLLRAWSMLVGTHIAQRDVDGLRRSVKRLKEIGRRNFVLATAEGHLAMMEGKRMESYAAFEEALSYRPNDIRTLEILVEVDAMLTRSNAFRKRVKLLLSLDPDNPVGNRMLGAIQISENQYDLAADSLRRVLERNRDPLVLNNLAWLLQDSGLYEEAESHAREALALNSNLHNAWDTLGSILLKTDRVDEARRAFEQALKLNDKNVSAAIQLMKMMKDSGERKAASKLLAKWLPQRDRLSPDAIAELNLLEKELVP